MNDEQRRIRAENTIDLYRDDPPETPGELRALSSARRELDRLEVVPYRVLAWQYDPREIHG